MLTSSLALGSNLHRFILFILNFSHILYLRSVEFVFWCRCFSLRFLLQCVFDSLSLSSSFSKHQRNAIFCRRRCWCGYEVERWYHLILYIFVQMENNYVVLVKVDSNKFKSDARREHTTQKAKWRRCERVIHFASESQPGYAREFFLSNFTFMHIKSFYFQRTLLNMRVVGSNQNEKATHIHERTNRQRWNGFLCLSFFWF